MNLERIISTIDSHTVGEPTRTVVNGIPKIPGETMVEKQRYFREHLDSIRTTLMMEPRGHPDLVGAVITDPVSQDGDFGVLFMDASGYEAMCGHGTIGIVTTLVETGQVQAERPITRVNVDTPIGTVTTEAKVVEDGHVTEVSFSNVPSFVYMPDAQVRFKGEEIATDIVFGGNFYAILPTARLGLSFASDNIHTLVEKGIAFRDAAKEQLEIRHPIEPDVPSLHGVQLFEDSPTPGVGARNLVVFAQRAYDRSPCGTGTSAKLALLHSKGEIDVGQEYIHESIIGTKFNAKIIEETSVNGYPAIIPEISGSAYITGVHQFFLDSRDPLKDGFLLG